MALVSQEVTIFDDTIAANIAYGCADRVSREEIEAAADAAALTDVIRALPDGLDTKVGAAGSALSGGPQTPCSLRLIHCFVNNYTNRVGCGFECAGIKMQA